MSEVIFRTVHGSHLYGMAGPHSDMDIYTVTTSKNRARQKVTGDTDSVVIGWDMFIQYAFSGSHQSVEALFSPYKEWESNHHLAPMLDGYRITGRSVFEKYGRTITSFAHSDDFKRRRHACRLWLNMQGLRWRGRFDPVMTEAEVLWATEMATSNLDGDELALLLREGESVLAPSFLRI